MGKLALSRTIVVLIWSLILSDISKSRNPNFLAAQDNVLWHMVLGDEVVKDVLMLPMMFAIGLPEYLAWLFLYIWLTAESFEKFSYGPKMQPRPEMRHVLCPLKD